MESPIPPIWRRGDSALEVGGLRASGGHRSDARRGRSVRQSGRGSATGGHARIGQAAAGRRHELPFVVALAQGEHHSAGRTTDRRRELACIPATLAACRPWRSSYISLEAPSKGSTGSPTLGGQMQDPSVGAPRGASLVAWLVPAGLVYFSLVGGTGPGELVPVLRLVNSAVGIGLIVLWLRAAPGRSDALDRWVLAALLLYLVSAVLAKSPHAALEAAMATTAYAALFFVMRTAMSDPGTRSRTALWLGLTGVVVAAAYVAIWLMVWSGWLGAGQPTSTLFYLPLPGGPYGFKHNVALVCGLLIPFLWISSSGVPGRVQRVIGIGVLVPVLIMAGSRALWVGAVLATLAAVGMRLAARRRLPGLNRRWWLVAAAGLVALGAVAWLAPDMARAIADRLGNLLTLSARADLWAASVTEWRTSVLTGVGPGGWPIWLPTTGYFDITAFSPRHPDSLLFQLLAEIGLAGVAAVLLIAAGVWRALRATPRPRRSGPLSFSSSPASRPTRLTFHSQSCSGSPGSQSPPRAAKRSAGNFPGGRCPQLDMRCSG